MYGTGTIALGALGAAYVWRRTKRTALSGRHALVTGGSRGLGRDVALELARQGCRVGILAHDQAELTRAADSIAAVTATRVDTFVCDLRDRKQIYETMREVLRRWGHIDILVNDAGVIQVGPIDHMGIDDFEEAMALHFWAPLHAIRAVLPDMQGRGGGRVVNISSVGGKVAIPHLAPYCASKFALVGLSDALRAELARYGIAVTTVAPGLMRTGSHPNVQLKGKHSREFAWFSLGLAAPGMSMSSESAARKIVRACRHRRPALELTLAAKTLIRANAFAPSLTGRAMTWLNRLLPSPTHASGSERRRGWDSQSVLSPSLFTRRVDREVARHNELAGHTPSELHS